jgi:hypothetical protein
MADNVGYTPGTGATVAADEIAGVLHQRVKIGIGTDGSATDVSSSNPMPVTGTVTANTGLSQPLTDAQLRAATVPISGTVTANTGLSQPLTDSQLRAAAVPVSGTFFQATQPVSGTVTANTGLSQPLTDAQLRASAVPVSVGSIALPTGASTSALQTTGNTSLSNIDGKLPALVSSRVPVDGSGVTQPVSGTFWQATQPVSIASSVPVTGPLTDAQLRASDVPISGTVTANTGLSQPLTDAQLRASAVPISGTVTANTGLTQPLTDTQLRATAIQIEGTVSGTAVPVSGTFFQATQPVSIAASVAVTGPLTDAQLRASDVPITGTVTANTPSTGAIGFPALSQATQVGGSDGTNLRILKTDSNGELQVDVVSSALPSGAATETTLTAVEVDTSSIATSASAINGKLAALSTRVLDNEASGAPVRAIGQEIWNVSFSQVGASVISDQFVAPQTGTGVSYSQASGALAIVAGTTANAEFFTRSTTTWRGSMRLKFSVVASQRIANTNLAVMLADLIGEGLTVTINSATSITVAQAGHAFTSTSVGQFVQVGRIVGANGVPGRYAIASVVAGTSYNLTVAGWPASGSCTATVFGHSYVRNLVTGTTATNINVDAQRRGWAQGDTTATINTTASPGTIITCELTGREVFWADQLRATTTTPTVAVRANRLENIPDDNLNLYLFVWSFNGTTAPASSTTWTMSFCSIEKFANMPVYIQGNRAQGAMNAAPVTVFGTATVSGTVTSNIGTGTLTAANLNFPGIIADLSSSALTSTTTTSAFTPTFGTCYSVNIVVTSVSGSFATMDVAIEESDDSGTNWFKVYDFPRITLGGAYRSPIMRLTGNRVRYVQTVGGTSPSFTRSINRLQSSTNNEAVRQLINRTIVLTTLNSTTPSLDTRDCGNRAQLVVNVGAITTTAPAIQLEGSDDNGDSWYSIGAPLTAVASSTVQQTVVDINAALMRARISTAGVGVTAGYVMIKAHD